MSPCQVAQLRRPQHPGAIPAQLLRALLITLVLAGCAAPREKLDWAALADYLEKQNDR